MINMPGWCLGL